MAEKYGPFVRFFPEGSELADDTDDIQISDDEAAAAAVKEAEEVTEEQVKSSTHFKGLLRDHQADRTALTTANAELAAARLANEEMQRQIAESQKPGAPEMSEEEAATEVTRGELQKTLAAHGKTLIENVTKALDSREARTTKANLKKNQAADAQALMRTCTAKVKGLTLDAKTVVDEAIAYLSTNDPELLESLSKRPDFASKVYQIAPSLVPSVAQRVKLRHNTLLAKKLDQKGDDTPGGGAPSGDDLSAFEAIMSSGEEMSDETLDKLYET